MFKRIVPMDQPLGEAIDAVLKRMEHLPPDSDEYAKCTKQLSKLYALQPKPIEGVSSDVLLTVAGNIVGICIICFHEKAHVITSKAFDRVKMLR
jgi:hypothetical protein